MSVTNQSNQNLINIAIQKLTTQYNIILNNLTKQLRQYINVINISKVSSNNKINLINNLTISYNNNVTKLTNDYNNKKRKLLENISTSNTKTALLIGINYINTPNELYGCINDTNNVKDLLVSQFNYNNFVILTDETNKKPTKQNIIYELTNLLVKSKSGDTLFVLYSGHGTCTVDINNDELDGQDELIVPLNGTNINNCILDDELSKIIRTNLKAYVKLFMVFDSCFSGTVMDLKYNYLTNTNSQNGLTMNPKVNETISQVFVISGCKDSQTSADAYVNYDNMNINSGAMTYSFLKTIQDLGIKISLKTLIENMRTILQEEGYQQVPQISSGQLADIETTMLSL